MLFSLLLSPVVRADVPDPGQCEVHPWDEMGQVLVSPGSSANGGSAIDSVTITVRAHAGYGLPGSDVRIILCDSPRLCVDSATPGLQGYTDGSGVVGLNPDVGGCESCTIAIQADGIVIREFHRIVSPDFDGTRGNGIIDDADAAYFVQACSAHDPCANLNGSGDCTDADQAIFQTAYDHGDHNPNRCALDPAGVAEDADAAGRGASCSLYLAPNPVSAGRLNCRFVLPSAGRVLLEVFDVSGRRVQSIHDGEMTEGEHALPANMDRDLPSGVYFIRMSIGGTRVTRALVKAGD